MIDLWKSKSAAVASLTKDRMVSPPVVVPMDSVVSVGPSADLLHEFRLRRGETKYLMWQGMWTLNGAAQATPILMPIETVKRHKASWQRTDTPERGDLTK